MCRCECDGVGRSPIRKTRGCTPSKHSNEHKRENNVFAHEPYHYLGIFAIRESPLLARSVDLSTLQSFVLHRLNIEYMKPHTRWSGYDVGIFLDRGAHIFDQSQPS